MRRPRERWRPASASPRSVAVGSRRQDAQHAVQVPVVEAVPGTLQAFVIGEYLLGTRYIAGCALQFNGVRTQVNGDVQPIFQHAHVLVPRAK